MAQEPQSPDQLDHVITGSPRAPGLLLSRITSAPEPRASLADTLFSPTVDSKFSKRDMTLEGPSQPPQLGMSSLPPRDTWETRGIGSRGELGEPPEKRLRLGYVEDESDNIMESSRRRMLAQNSGSYIDPGKYRPSAPPVEDASADRPWRGSCSSCSGTEVLVLDLVQGFLELQSEVTRALTLSTGRKSPTESVGPEVTKLGLRQALTWTLQEIRNTNRLIRSSAVMAKPGLPSLADVVPSPFVHDIRRLSIHGQTSMPSSSINDPRRSVMPSDAYRRDDQHRRQQEQPSLQMPRPYDQAFPPILQGEEIKRHALYENATSGSGQSPHPSSASSVIGSAQSPMQSQPSTRTLPSPPGGQYSRIGGSDYTQFSQTATQSAHNTHLQDLQHQISTKTLALQTLQREHDQLLAAFSRSQIRCTALDKKSQVSDHEINTLTEDKIRLQQQVESLEGQVHELMRSRDEAHQQSSADGAQWRQIMAMSSQLQIKGADEARRFKAERDAWELERESLQKRVDGLESGKENPARTGAVSGSTTPVANDSILTSSSVEFLRDEIVRLRRRCVESELMVQELAGEAEEVENAISAMENVRKTLSSKKHRRSES